MSDFIVRFNSTESADQITQMLTQSQYLRDRVVNTVDYNWGRAYFLQPPGDIVNIHHSGDETIGFIGRPRFTEDRPNALGSEAYFQRLKENWGDAKNLSQQLTGMYSLLRCHNDGVEVITDLMGIQPVYQVYTPSGELAAIGTNVEVLAQIAGRAHDFDAVSLGELLVYNHVTFPYTSRNGITEFKPACHITISVSPDGQIRAPLQAVFWQPLEVFDDDNPEQKAEDLVTRMRYAGDDIAGSAKSIGVTLSGGLDSRAVLSLLPAEKVTAVTYVTHENYETDTARKVSDAYGCEHILAQRQDDFFSNVLLEHGPTLMGMERRAMIHGLCLVQSDVSTKFDVILGGQLSDTYLKNHYMPTWQREIFRHKGIRENAMSMLRKILGFPTPVAEPGMLTNLGRYLLARYLSDDVCSALAARRSARLEEVRKIRPQTCEEWVRFWPTSRQDDLSHVMGNSKLFHFETLFTHRQIIEFATTLTPWQRYDGRIANKAFIELYGNLANIRDANTGAVPGRISRRRNTIRKSKPVDRGIETKPWDNVPTSWFDMEILQKQDEHWQNLRESLRDSAAPEVILPILDPSARDIINEYQDFLGPTFNQMFMQLSICIAKL